MTTPWYYEYYEKGKFPHQQKLCKAVEWTGCNLEGQRLVPNTLTGADGTKTKTSKLTGQVANPLTIRLIGLRIALNQLRNKVNQINRTIRKQKVKQFNKGEMFEIKGQFLTASSSVQTSGAPVDEFEISGEEKPLKFYHVKAHFSLYQFFSNLGSAMDRLAYEIDLLYQLNIPKVDWPKLVDTRPQKDKYWKMLNNKDPMLARFIRNSPSKLEQALSYRNRLIHDGIIRVEVHIGLLVNKGISGLSVKLAEDPNNDGSLMNVDAIDFCLFAKADVLKLVDGSYELMLQHLQTHGNPPW